MNNLTTLPEQYISVLELISSLTSELEGEQPESSSLLQTNFIPRNWATIYTLCERAQLDDSESPKFMEIGWLDVKIWGEQ